MYARAVEGKLGRRWRLTISAAAKKVRCGDASDGVVYSQQGSFIRLEQMKCETALRIRRATMDLTNSGVSGLVVGLVDQRSRTRSLSLGGAADVQRSRLL